VPLIPVPWPRSKLWAVGLCGYRDPRTGMYCTLHRLHNTVPEARTHGMWVDEEYLKTHTVDQARRRGWARKAIVLRRAWLSLTQRQGAGGEPAPRGR